MYGICVGFIVGVVVCLVVNRIIRIIERRRLIDAQFKKIQESIMWEA